MSHKAVEKLFYELSSESRLDILNEVLNEGLKMQDLARRVDLTATEAFRQLQRLSDAGLVKRQPDGTYAITPYGRLEMQLARSLGFVFDHRDYFMEHDVWRLPGPFVNRVVELSGAVLVGETMDAIVNVERIQGEAEERVWGIGEGRFTERMGSVSSDQVSGGLEYRVLSPLPHTKMAHLENRTLTDIPVVLLLTEKEAMVSLRRNDGRMDYAGFMGKDEAFLVWARDLFKYYWDECG